jgi:hypothetical protein
MQQLKTSLQALDVNQPLGVEGVPGWPFCGDVFDAYCAGCTSKIVAKSRLKRTVWKR